SGPLMRDPLLLPFVMFAAGILLGTAVEFTTLEALWPTAALTILALASGWRNSRYLSYTASSLALFFAGVLAQAWHRPGPPPELDAGSRELVLVTGCVVEPTVFSADRAQFTLELDPDARARVSLPTED